MIIAPNMFRRGVIGGFVIEPPAISTAAYFTPNSTWIGIGIPGSGWMPEVGDEIEFVLDDAYSGMPLVAGSAFNYRGPWAANTNYAVGDCFVWYTSGGQLVLWLVMVAFNSGTGFNPSLVISGSPAVRQMNFRGAYATGTAYTIGDLVLAPDTHGYTQTWVALSSFTSGGGPFAPGSQWAECLPSETAFYVVSVNEGQIQIATTPTGVPITFMSGSFFLTPDTGAQITAYFGTSGFGPGSGLTPALSVGALFSNGAWWIPTTPPSCPAAPANQRSYLCYNLLGLYWTTNPLGDNPADAVIGWVVTDATDILAASYQNVPVGDDNLGSGNLPGIIPFASAEVPTPTCGIADAGDGNVSFDPITFASGADTSQLNAATIVLLYQDATAAATAHLTAALAGGVPEGTAATLSVDTDLTGIVEAGDWLLAGSGEMMYVTADATSGGVAVERALGLTTSAAQAIGQAIYLLISITYSYSFPIGFFATPDAANWGPTEQLPNANIALFNIVVWSETGGESEEAPINYSQATGGLISTGAPSSVGFLAAAHAIVAAGAASANLGIARSVTVGPLTGHTTIGAINTTGSAPFLWALTVQQDSVGGRAMIPGSGMTVALSTEQSPANTQITGLFLYDGAGNHILLASTGDIPIP